MKIKLIVSQARPQLSLDICSQEVITFSVVYKEIFVTDTRQTVVQLALVGCIACTKSTDSSSSLLPRHGPQHALNWLLTHPSILQKGLYGRRILHQSSYCKSFYRYIIGSIDVYDLREQKIVFIFIRHFRHSMQYSNKLPGLVQLRTVLPNRYYAWSGVALFISPAHISRSFQQLFPSRCFHRHRRVSVISTSSAGRDKSFIHPSN